MSRRPGRLAGSVVVGLWALGAGGVGEAQPVRAPGMVEVVVSVELSCPSCAQGLERRFSRLEHVSRVEVQVDESQVVLGLEPGTTVSLEAVWDVVRNAGFTPDRLTLTAVGRLVEVPGGTALGVGGDVVLVLAGDQVADLSAAAREDLVEVSGELALGTGDGPPTLTVAGFTVG